MNIKRLLMLTLVMLPLAVMAQMKIATVDVQAVFDAMPESKLASEQLEKASQQYKAEYEMMQMEFNGKYAAYQGLASDTPATIRDRRVREIQDTNSEIEAFLARSQASLNAMKQELEAPIYAKINAAIKEVGDNGRYTYIIDVSKTPVVYSGVNAIDLTNQVKKALGVE
ncbi:MAG: OmpH family outer membrane protein [Muribaculaceae bacterium]|nr:OmpH family outer membrane protein [Muribaculaceae bacterium]